MNLLRKWLGPPWWETATEGLIAEQEAVIAKLREQNDELIANTERVEAMLDKLRGNRPSEQDGDNVTVYLCEACGEKIGQTTTSGTMSLEHSSVDPGTGPHAGFIERVEEDH